MSPVLSIVGALLLALFLTGTIIPKIVKVAIIRNLTDKPGDRKIHSRQVPTLGGIAIFTGFFISLMLFANGHIEHVTIIAAASLLIFTMGEKDDLVTMSPLKKLSVEVISAILVVTVADIRITNLHGLLGIEALPLWLSIIVSVFILIFIINAFNFIDGIDGLASSVGILVTVLFAVWFWIARDIGYSIMAASVAGALCAFLPFNVYNGRFKIFMGDTGSLTVGLFLAILTIRFNELNFVVDPAIRFISAPAILLAILILPLYDSVRVTIIRLYKGQNPFVGDNNHLHHRLLRLGFSHIKSTLILVAANMAIILLAVSLNKFGVNTVFISVVAASFALSMYFVKLEKKLVLQKEIEGTFRKVVKLIPEKLVGINKNVAREKSLKEKYESAV